MEMLMRLRSADDLGGARAGVKGQTGRLDICADSDPVITENNQDMRLTVEMVWAVINAVERSSMPS
jgi:hypothetical protein